MIHPWKALVASAAVVASLSAATTIPIFAQTPATPDALAEGFKNPPGSAKPRTWWHWTMSNVTKEGITKDLGWRKRVGIGGFMLGDVNADGGQNVEIKKSPSTRPSGSMPCVTPPPRPIASDSVNGTSLGSLWCPPYRIDVGSALKAGDNHLEIKVTNEWTNQIIGDSSLPPEKKILSPGAAPESGLLGPVTMVSVTSQ